MTTPTALPGTRVADPVHPDVSFRVRHLGVGRVRGAFGLTSATTTISRAEFDIASAAAGERS